MNKYLAIDTETTGIDPDNCQMIMLSMIVEDVDDIQPLENLPHFTCFVKRDLYQGEPYALGLNGWIFKEIASKNPRYPAYSVDDTIRNAQKFLVEHFGFSRITIAGKCAGVFDMRFIPKEISKMFRHRILDVGPVFVDWTYPGFIKSLDTLKQERGLSDVAHDAYEDALDVIRVLREKYAQPESEIWPVEEA